ncbi:MAG: thiamine pyrophosphate-binding protein [Bradyrhizobium sp.]
MPLRTVADVIARVFRSHGVNRVFGVPGGGCSLDLIAAFERVGIPYVLARTEAAAAIMAASTAEATGTLGVVMTTQGPGVASAVNGVAQASLDRAPVILISDGWTEKQASFDTHQVFDQKAVMKPLVKASSRLDCDDVTSELENLVATARQAPWGPVFIELTGETVRRVVDDHESGRVIPEPKAPSASQIGKARELLATARKPVILVGLEARSRDAGELISAFAGQLGAPILATYKAKGVVPDKHPQFIGLFTGGAVERECVGQADLIVLCGLDPVELIGRPWPYQAPVLDLGPVDHPIHYVQPAVRVDGDLSLILEALSPAQAGGGWDVDTFAGMRATVASRLSYRGQDKGASGLSPEAVVRTALELNEGNDARVTVDAGAHMFSCMAFWPVARRADALISNGLSTMAFSLPAAIAMSLETPDRPVIAFTGDGGLMMCAGELSTAAQHAARLCIVVFNDSSLSLIAIKQEQRQFGRSGVGWPCVDFAAVARGFGLQGYSAASIDEYRDAMKQAIASGKPALIDVKVDPTGYLAQSIALRG